MGSCLLLLVYFFTSSRDLYWFDSAELALAGLQNGLSHPPGQPLYTLLLHSGVNLGGEPLIWMNFVSNAAGALCVLPVCSICTSLLGRRREGSFLLSTMIVVLAAGGGIIPQLWESSTRVEVYSLTGLLGLMQIALLLPVLEGDKPAGRTFWFFQGLLFGLLACTNPVLMVIHFTASAAAVLPALISRKMKTGPSFFILLAGLAAGLLPYLHVFAVAGLKDRFVWGAPQDFTSFMFYITGRDYAHNLGAGPGEVLRHMGIFFAWSFKKGLAVLIAAGVSGWLLLLLRRRSSLVLLFSVFILSLVWSCLNKPYLPDIPDFYNYLFGSTWLILAGAVSLIVVILRRLETGAVKKVACPMVAGLWIATLSFLPPALWTRSRAENRVPREMAMAVLGDTPENAILIVSSDHMFFPLFYLTEGEGVREDVVLLNPGWASSSWYWDLLYERHGDLKKFNIEAPNRWERIHNFLLANYERDVAAENLNLGNLSGRLLCMGGWTVWTEKLCMDDFAQERVKRRDEARDKLKSWAVMFGKRRTIDEKVLSFVGVSWGHDERIMGRNRAAVKSYLAGAGMDWEEAVEPVHDRRLERLPSPGGPVLLSSPSRNVFYAAHIIEFFDPGLARKLYALSGRLSY